MNNITEAKIGKMLRQLSISPSLLGYDYIKYCINRLCDGKRYKIMQLYKEVADAYGTTVSRVERGIRHVVLKCLEEGDLDLKDEVFGCVQSYDGHLTNSEFIMGIYTYLEEVGYDG